jgi:hypothetical protein
VYRQAAKQHKVKLGKPGKRHAEFIPRIPVVVTPNSFGVPATLAPKVSPCQKKDRSQARALGSGLAESG